jgi:FlaA1/EpsC-like NDP-sugar epimerase
MKSYLLHFFSKYFLPRWLVFLFDVTTVFLSWFIAFLLRFNFDLSGVAKAITPMHLIIIMPVFVYFFWKSKAYCGVLRCSTTEDVIKIIFTTFYAGLILAFVSLLSRLVNAPSFLIMPLSVIIIFTLLVTAVLVASRLLAKIMFFHWIKTSKKSQKVMIFGAGRLGQTTLDALLSDHSVNYKVAGFIDDNVLLHNKYVSGIPIYSEQKAFGVIIPKNNVAEVIIAVNNSKISHKRKLEITDKCLHLKIMVKEVPPIETWISGGLQVKAIRPVKIEDLLGRNSIQLDRKRIALGLKNSVVLVTGAAGSIGSEIVRQLIAFNVKKVILLDKAESDLYNLEQEIITNGLLANFEVVVGDVTNKTRMWHVFSDFNPTIVFNAAAYKHVPLMEKFPYEAFRVNVGGLKNMADLAAQFGVEKFVFISTDKAVNPTNVMGATKRIGEIYIQSLAQSQNVPTQFITTRFGNVLGSNGSVVPLFKKQIEKGGPVTVTHKEVRRYFMTIPEACQLVLEAGFMGKGGEIFVFDMGDPVKIYDLAKKMISLSGFVPGLDIEIKTVGLRPGEKLYEELLSNKEVLLQRTHNNKIMIGKNSVYDYHSVNKKISTLLENIDLIGPHQIVHQMMELVPEFVSGNPDYINGKKVQLPLSRQTVAFNSFPKNRMMNQHKLYKNATLAKRRNGNHYKEKQPAAK